VTADRNKYLLKKYGITSAQYEEMLAKQNGNCAICGQHHTKFKMRLSVDHCHKTQEVRGLLCFICNRFIMKTIDLYQSRILPALTYKETAHTGWFVPPKVKKKKRRKK
jgi:hypothetical protein